MRLEGNRIEEMQAPTITKRVLESVNGLFEKANLPPMRDPECVCPYQDFRNAIMHPDGEFNVGAVKKIRLCYVYLNSDGEIKPTNYHCKICSKLY